MLIHAKQHGKRSIRGIVSGWLSRERYLLLAVGVLGVAIGVVYNMRSPPLHQSTVVVYLDEAFVGTDDAPDLRVRPSDGLRRLRYEAVSNSTLKKLAVAHGLSMHYGLPDDLPGRETYAIALLRSRVEVLHDDRSGLSITVEDRDRHKAVALARDLYRTLAKSLEDRAAAHLKRVANIYDRLGREMAADVERERQLLTRMLALQDDVDPDGRKVFDMVDVGTRLNVANGELAQLRFSQRSASILAGKEHLPQLVLLQEASLDHGPGPYWTGAIRTLFIVAMALMLTIIVRIAWNKNKEELHELVEDWIGAHSRNARVAENGPTDGEGHVRSGKTERREPLLSEEWMRP